MITGIFAIAVLASLVGGGIYWSSPENWQMALSAWMFVFGLGNVILSTFAAFSARNHFKAMVTSSRMYERDISTRLAIVEARTEEDKDAAELLVELAEDNDRLSQKVSRLSDQMKTAEEQLAAIEDIGIASVNTGNASGNVIKLEDAAEARKRNSGVSRAKAGNGKVASGICEIDTKGEVNVAPLLQPIVSLPHKELQYYEAFASMHAKDGTLVEARDFIPAFEKEGRVHDVDLAILDCVITLIRKLQREGREDQIRGVFWNISVNSITRKTAFTKICSMLKAHENLSDIIQPEVDISALEGSINDQAHEMGLLARKGFKFSLDVNSNWAGTLNGQSRREMKQLVKRLLTIVDQLPLSFVKVPARVLLRQENDGSDRFVDLLLPEMEKRKIILVGSQVEHEEQAINLIDHFIEYAQGSYICPPKPVNPGNGSDVDKAGKAEAG